MLEFNNREPIYVQLIERLRDDIISGNLKKGEKLPSIRDYANKVMVNPNTVQKVYSELEIKNYIFSKRGIGYYVSEDDQFIRDKRENYLDKEIEKFLNKMKFLGFSNEEIIKKLKERI